MSFIFWAFPDNWLSITAAITIQTMCHRDLQCTRKGKNNVEVEVQNISNIQNIAFQIAVYAS